MKAFQHFSLGVLRTLLWAGVALAVAAGSPPTTNSIAEVKPPCCRELPTTRPSEKSLYQLDSEWTSDVDRRVRLGVLQGRVQVLVMFFTHCEYACPLIIRDLKRIQSALPPASRSQVDFLLVSLDPERDTPRVLRAYREKASLDTDHWTLLTGRSDDVRELAVLLGVNYRPDARGQFAHSNLITVLNPAGEIAFQQSGLDRPAGETVAAIATLLPTP